MVFKTIKELVDIVNAQLGDFCNDFVYARKDLAKLGRSATRGRLFTYDEIKDKNWAINEGGGTEIQYHIAFIKEDLEIRYGLGFNTQYVPFANDIPSVEYMRPFMVAFLKYETTIKNTLNDYGFVYGGIEELKNPQNDEYTLWGKVKNVTEKNDGFEVSDNDLDEIVNDLKRQFEIYKLIFIERNRYKKTTMNIQNTIELLKQKGQIILQGPAGTGKTYTAKDIAEQIIFNEISIDKSRQKTKLESSSLFKIVQFHPSYSYEDFVRGIVAKSNGNTIEYITENKTLAKFATEANHNYLNSLKSTEELSFENWIEDKFSLFREHIQERIDDDLHIILTKKVGIIEVEENSFIYDGLKGNGWKVKRNMNFRDIIIAYKDENKDRQDIVKNKNLSGLARQHATYFLSVLKLFQAFIDEQNLIYEPNTQIKNELKDFVLIIDEINRANLPSVLGELIYGLEYRGEKIDCMYSIDNDSSIVIPPNLYIIGTMNTSDRSVGHIDYAIRRRFAFVDVLPQVISTDNFELELFKKVSSLFIKNVDEYIGNNITSLISSEYLSEDFKPEEVWLGHSYFLKKDSNFQLRKQYEIIPILKEYIKDGILKQTAEEFIYTL